MSSKASKKPEPNSKKHHSSNSKSNSTKNDDWAEITDPEERRRIQNRLAQRKFRKKNQDSKEKASRDAQNDANASNTYSIASPSTLMPEGEGEESGLPWGSINIHHIVSRGQEHETRRSSGRGEYVNDDTRYASTYGTAYMSGYQQAASYGSSGGEEYYYDGNSPYYHDFDQSCDVYQGQGYSQRS